MRITKSFVEKAESPKGKDQVFYRDGELKGFALRVTASGAKSFVVETLIGNKVRRMTLGRYGKLTVEQARKEAQKLLGKIACGVDPLAERNEQKARSVTLKEVFADYLKARKALKQTTVRDYQRIMVEVFSDWENKPLLDITKDMVAKRHRKHGEKSEARANLSMRFLRALFNFAAGQYEDSKGQSLILENPVKRLSHTRAWYRVERRQTVIKPHELVLSRQSQSTSEYLFPGNGKTGYNVEPRKVMNKVIDKSGIKFTLHDLRRTFITIAESLDIPAYALKRLLNHKMNHDVTAGYIVMDVERLRVPMQRITDHLLKLMDLKETAKIVEIHQKGEKGYAQHEST